MMIGAIIFVAIIMGVPITIGILLDNKQDRDESK